MRSDGLMTVSDLVRRTGMSAKLIRRFTDLGLIYSPGRSATNYRMFDESALWCVRAISSLRDLGLTIREIKAIGTAYINEPDSDVRTMVEHRVREARRRARSSMDQLTTTLERQHEVLSHSEGLAALTGPDPTRS